MIVVKEERKESKMIDFKSSFKIKTLGMLGLFLCLTGCSDENMSDLDQYINKIKARPKGTIDALPENKTIEPFLFNLDGSRNPFKPVDKPEDEDDEETDNVSKKGIHPDFTRRKEDLEDYPLDTLEMVGTIKKETLWGLIRSKEGVQKVKVGNYMGLNHGRIIQITDNQIDLIEIVKDKKPKVWFKQSAKIRLKTVDDAE